MIWRWLRKQLGFVRPPRETYVRASRPCERAGWVVEPGVEFRDGDSFEQMRSDLYQCCYTADVNGHYTLVGMAEAVGYLIELNWPGRAYFVEVHGPEGWIQIFQPFGVPRNDK